MISELSQDRKKTDRSDLWLEHITQNQMINGQLDGITTKISPLFDGPTSWFKYEELIDDWLDLTMLEAGTRGPALKTRLLVLNRESLKAGIR